MNRCDIEDLESILDNTSLTDEERSDMQNSIATARRDNIRDKAIEMIRGIQNGDALSRDRELAEMVREDEFKDDLWHNDEFSYGMEYGAIVALIKLFDIRAEEL